MLGTMIGVNCAASESMDTLVSPDWLIDHLHDENLVVVDSTVLVRFNEQQEMTNESGVGVYREGHIPGAVFADLLGDFSDPAERLRLPTPDAMAAALGNLGINNSSRVVVYSTDNMVWAARFWWMLRWMGHDEVALLDGGLSAWTDAGLTVESGEVARGSMRYVANTRPELVSDHVEVSAAIEQANTHLVDALPREHYEGLFTLYSRPGHIPTAVNIPTNNLTDANGAFRPTDELELLFDTKKDERMITYCGGGVAASGVAFAAHRAGYTNVSVYMGSLQEWTADESKALVTGPAP